MILLFIALIALIVDGAKLIDGVLMAVVSILTLHIMYYTFVHLKIQIVLILYSTTYIEVLCDMNEDLSISAGVHGMSWYNNFKDVFGSPYLLFL